MPLAHTVRDAGGPARLVDYLKARLVVVPVTEIGDLVTTGRVRIRGGAAPARTDDRIRDGDVVEIDDEALAALRDAGRWTVPWARQPDVLFEDGDLVVVDKRAGVHVHPLGDRRGHTLVAALLHRAGARDDEPFAAWRPHVAQRLDCVVSGVVVVAKSARAKDALVRQQKRRAIARTYVALVEGSPPGEDGLVDAPVGREAGRGWRRAVVAVVDGGRDARTRWRVLERRGALTLLEVSPETGRTHQIRVHLASLGTPIAGDRLYGARSDAGPPLTREGDEAVPAREGATLAEGTGRLGEALVLPIALHASRVTLLHPRSEAPLAFASPLPTRFGAEGRAFLPRGA